MNRTAVDLLRNRTRLRILGASQSPLTAAEIAEEIDTSVTTVHHHLTRMLNAGLVDVVDEQRRGDTVARVYRAAVDDYELDGDLDDVAEMLKDALRDARSSSDDFPRSAGRTVATISAQAAASIAKSIAAIVEELDDADGDEGEFVAFTHVFAPLAGRSAVNYSIRPATPKDLSTIQRVLYLALGWDPQVTLPDIEVVLAHPEVARYHRGWGRHGDLGVVAELNGEPVGGAFGRLFDAEDHGHGFVDETTPEIGIAVWEGHRAKGLGHRLLAALESEALASGIGSLSLSVNVGNPATRLYEAAGYRTISSDESSLVMVKKLHT